MAAEKLYKSHNFPAPTTAISVGVTTGTGLKTMLQLATPATTGLYVVSWGVSFDGAAGAAGIQCELFGCTGAATVTAHAAAGIVSLTDPQDTSVTKLTLGTTATGYTASGEGTPANVRMFDSQYVAPNGGYAWEFALGREPKCAVSTFVRIRLIAAVAVNCKCWIVWGET